MTEQAVTEENRPMCHETDLELMKGLRSDHKRGGEHLGLGS